MFGGLFAPEAVEPGWFGLDSYYATAWFDEESADTSSGVGSSRNPAPLPHLGLILDPTLAASAGSFALTGVDAAFDRPNRVLTGETGVYTWTGVAASLDATIAPTLPAHARPGLFSADAVKPGWFEPSIYSDVVWFDKEYGYLYSVGAPAYLPHLTTLFEEQTGLTGSAGAYTYTGVAAILRATRYMPLAAGSYTYTGVAAGLSYSAVNSSRNPAPLPSLGLVLDYSNILTASAGSYAISGAATLKAGRILAAAAASYTLTGVNALLAKSGEGGQPPAYLPHIGLLLAPGAPENSISYPASLPSLSSIMGHADGVYAMNGNTGIFTWTGIAATFRHGYVLTAESGSYVTDFSRVARDYQLTASGTSYTLSGSAATIGRGFTLTCGAGSFAMTGVDAAFRYEQPGVYVLNALAGVFTWDGNPAAFAGGTRTLVADSGTLLVSGQNASYLLNGVAPVTTPAGGAGSKSKRRRHFVKVDGKHYEVRDYEHAVEFLKSLQKKPPVKPPKVRLVKPVRPATFTKDLEQQVEATNQILARMYAEALKQEEAEIEELISIGVL